MNQQVVEQAFSNFKDTYSKELGIKIFRVKFITVTMNISMSLSTG